MVSGQKTFLTLLDLHEPRRYGPTPPLTPLPFALNSSKVSKGRWPARGLVYSFLVHEVTLFSMLLLPVYFAATPKPPLQRGQLFEIDLSAKDKLVYYPDLGEEGKKVETKGKKKAASDTEPVEAAGLRTKGLSYPGPQPIVSDVPKPTNRFQTLLQPALENPKILPPPIALPNIIQMADAGPLPKPEPPPPAPTPLKKDLVVADPSRVAVQPRNAAALPAPAAPAVPAPESIAQPATPVKRDLVIVSPPRPQVIPQRPKIVLAVAEPELPTPERPIEPPTALKKDLVVEAPSGRVPTAQAPRTLPVNAPAVASPDTLVQPATPVKKDLVVAAPSQPAVPTPRVPKTALAVDAPGVTSPDKLVQPATPVKKDLVVAAPSQPAVPTAQVLKTAMSVAAPTVTSPDKLVQPATPVKKDLVVNAPSVPTLLRAPQVATLPSQGPDAQNLFSLNPLPAPPQQTAKIPSGEARGRVAVSPEPNLSASLSSPGVDADNLATNAFGAARKVDGVTGNTPGANGTAPAANNPGTGKSNGSAAPNGEPVKTKAPGEGNSNTKTDGNGAGAGNGTGRAAPNNPFGGITIQRGDTKTTGITVAKASPPTGTISVGTPPSSPSAAAKGSYEKTIVATSTSGGGLPDVGVFAHEQVYTVYVDMKYPTETVAPSWTLEYAIVQSAAAASRQQTAIAPPFPVTKPMPDFPAEVVKKNLKRLVIVYGVIDTQGKMQQMSVKESPDPLLNKAALAALSKWVFRPAEVAGEPAAVKVLLGIPLSLP